MFFQRLAVRQAGQNYLTNLTQGSWSSARLLSANNGLEHMQQSAPTEGEPSFNHNRQLRAMMREQ